ncbi:hypothetical protein O5699_01150 [Escherichia coli]|nr:hypothetical protein [Escherichia coli]
MEQRGAIGCAGWTGSLGKRDHPGSRCEQRARVCPLVSWFCDASCCADAPSTAQ